MARCIALTGAAGLIGQNLVPRLKARGYTDIIAVDKHPANTATLRRLHPDITVIEADLARAGEWQRAVAAADTVIVSHAQIGGLDPAAFTANNVTATSRLIDAVAVSAPNVIQISSSVVNSVVADWYSESKKLQEKLMLDSGLAAVVLRPTLMFGWFDRKHLGWLARFMQKTLVFPVPGSGQYLRQPLYAGDFCNIILSCFERPPADKVYNISGLEQIEYIDLIRAVRKNCGAGAAIIPIPYRLFWALLYIYEVFDRNPPFTTKQLEALVTPETFEVIDWPGIFGVQSTPLDKALAETFRHPIYSKIALEF
jgi:nucleoside-diphosphate-sugar epimerase